MITSRALLGLLALVCSTKTSESSGLNYEQFETLQTSCDSDEMLAQDTSGLHIGGSSDFEDSNLENSSSFSDDDHEEIFEGGKELWEEGLDVGLEAAIANLDEEIGRVFAQDGMFYSAAILISGFLGLSDHQHQTKIMKQIIEISLKNDMIHLLRALQFIHNWPCQKQFHQYMAQSYKKEWHDEEAWGFQLMDWDENLESIFEADNPTFYMAIGMSKIPAKAFFNLDKNGMLDMIIKHDSLKICKILGFANAETLNGRLKQLAEFSSTKILRYLLSLAPEDNLHLENNDSLEKLPKNIGDLEFFMEQGYQYFPVKDFLKIACKEGRVDILEYLFNLDSILKPDETHLRLAAAEGHISVLKWAKDHEFNITDPLIVGTLTIHGHLKALEWIHTDFGWTMEQFLLDGAASTSRLDVVKWAYSKFGLLPEVKSLANTSVEILEWLRAVDPKRINIELASTANADNLEWMWNCPNYRDLFTEEVKEAQVDSISDKKKMMWIFENWNKLPRSVCWAASGGDLESLKWAFEHAHIVPSARAASMAAARGNFELLKWIHATDPAILDENSLAYAVGYGHLEIADYFDPILNPQHELIGLNLAYACADGRLKPLQWAFENYKDFPCQGARRMAISFGHLELVKWMADVECINATEAENFRHSALSNGHDDVYFYLNEKYGLINPPSDNDLAWNSGNLRFFQTLQLKGFEINAKAFQNQSVTVKNYHLWRWLCDQKLWEL